MSKIDEYEKLAAEVGDALKRYHAWTETSDAAPTGYFLRQHLVKVTKSGKFFVLLEEHMNAMLAMALRDAKSEAEQFLKKVEP